MIAKRGETPMNAVLLVTRNCESTVEAFLRGAEARKDDLGEIVVVDVGSTDDTRKKITDFFGIWGCTHGGRDEGVIWTRPEIRLHKGGGIDFDRVHPMTNINKDLSQPFIRLVLRRWRWWQRLWWWGGPRTYAKSLVTAMGFVNLGLLDGGANSIGGSK